MAKRIVARIFAWGKRGNKCPSCGSTNTSSPEGDISHCFDCGHTWK